VVISPVSSAPFVSHYLQGGSPNRLAVVVVGPTIDGLGPVSGGVSVEVGGLKNIGELGGGTELLAPTGEPKLLEGIEVENVELCVAPNGWPDEGDESDDGAVVFGSEVELDTVDGMDGVDNVDGVDSVAGVDNVDGADSGDGVDNVNGADSVDVDGVDNVDPDVLFGVNTLVEAGTHGVDGCPIELGDDVTGAAGVVPIGGFIGLVSVGDWVC
jgi:hypothetical protein